jgi:hypothetical protein
MISKTYYKTKDYCKVAFSLTNLPAATIDILGLKNDWDSPISMRKGKDGSFSASVHLPKESIHEFKYLIDQLNWVNDSSADGQVPNAFGSTNSVLSL